MSILPVRGICGIVLAQPVRAIALQLNEVNAKILKIEQFSLLATREIGVAAQTNYDLIR